MPDVPDTNGTGTGNASWRDKVALIVALVILVIFVGFAVYVLSIRKATDPEWSHAVYVFASVEAIAFAAAGFLFGTEVNRKRADTAEEQTTKADQRATEERNQTNTAQARANTAEVQAQKGAALAKQVVAKNRVWEQEKQQAVFGRLGQVEAEAAASTTRAELNELAEVAQSFFPESEQ